MPDNTYLLGDAERDALNRQIEKDARTPINKPAERKEVYTPEQQKVYVVVPPCGEGIPARVDTEPGKNKCCLFQLLGKYTDTQELVPVLNDDGHHLIIEVQNIYDLPVWPAMPPNEYYIRVERDRFGVWFCEAPLANKEPLASTSTSSTSSAYVSAMCFGDDCKFIWSAANFSWTPPAENSCHTTTTTSTSSSSTTTPDPCLCPTTSTSSTSSTTQVPEDPCECLWPDFCGTVDGECTYTHCSQLRNYPPVCPGTTTTSSTSSTTSTSSSSSTSCPCDCNTTSTTTANACQAGQCEFYYVPANSPGFDGWVHGTDTCPIYCPCPDPNDIWLDPQECVIYNTGCITTSTTTPNVDCITTCAGLCVWYWAPGSDHWVFITPLGEGCVGGCCCPDVGAFRLCVCPPPSVDGEDCEIRYTSCACNFAGCPSTSTSSTTTPHLCECCYSTSSTSSTSGTTTSTSSSSTTTNPCQRYCVWQADMPNGWTDITPEGQECPQECPCVPPDQDPHEDCERQRTPCGIGNPTTTSTSTSTTTTTTTSTTSTSTTTPQVAGFYCEISAVVCSFFADSPGPGYLGPYELLGDCNSNCTTTSTSTTSTTTTTTTTTTSSTTTSTTSTSTTSTTTPVCDTYQDGFEDGTVLPWVAIGNHGVDGTLSIDNTFRLSGTNSMQVHYTGGAGITARLTFTTCADTTVSFWYYNDSATNWQWQTTQNFGACNIQNAWTFVSTILFGAGTYTLQFVPGDGNLWIDDLQITNCIDPP